MEIQDGDQIVVKKENEKMFKKTVRAFIKTKQFDRKSILTSYILACDKFFEAYREKYGKEKVFPLLQASMILKQLFANILEEEGIKFNRNALFHFEDERDKKKEQKADNENDAAVMASKIRKKAMAGASC